MWTLAAKCLLFQMFASARELFVGFIICSTLFSFVVVAVTRKGGKRNRPPSSGFHFFFSERCAMMNDVCANCEEKTAPHHVISNWSDENSIRVFWENAYLKSPWKSIKRSPSINVTASFHNKDKDFNCVVLAQLWVNIFKLTFDENLPLEAFVELKLTLLVASILIAIFIAPPRLSWTLQMTNHSVTINNKPLLSFTTRPSWNDSKVIRWLDSCCGI